MLPIRIALTGASTLLGIVACLPSPAFGREKTDVLVMNNGDRITCAVKSLEAGIIKADLDYVDGTISIDWLKVARIESKALFLVQLKDGSTYSGNVITPATLSGTPTALAIQDQEQQPFMVSKADVVRITQTSESLLQRFSGDFTIGAQYSKGNNTTQYNFGSELDYIQTRWGSRLNYSSSLSSSSGATAATRNQVEFLTYRLLPWKPYFYAGSAGFLQSSVQGIQRQTNLGLALGRYLKNTNRMAWTVMAGLGWQRTHYEPAAQVEPIQNIGVAVVTSNLEVFSFKKTRLDINAALLPAITQAGRSFAKVNVSYYLKLFGKIDWNLSFYGNWDTQPPGNLPSSDYGSSTGLSYSFGNK